MSSSNATTPQPVNEAIANGPSLIRSFADLTRIKDQYLSQRNISPPQRTFRDIPSPGLPKQQAAERLRRAAMDLGRHEEHDEKQSVKFVAKGQYSQKDWEIMSWELLHDIEEAQRGVCRVPPYHAASGIPTYQSFNSFRERFDCIVEILERSKSTAISCLNSTSFKARFAWSPAKEAKRKTDNALLNDVRSKKGKAQRAEQALDDDDDQSDQPEPKRRRTGRSTVAAQAQGSRTYRTLAPRTSQLQASQQQPGPVPGGSGHGQGMMLPPQSVPTQNFPQQQGAYFHGGSGNFPTTGGGHQQLTIPNNPQNFGGNGQQQQPQGGHPFQNQQYGQMASNYNLRSRGQPGQGPYNQVHPQFVPQQGGYGQPPNQPAPGSGVPYYSVPQQSRWNQQFPPQHHDQAQSHPPAQQIQTQQPGYQQQMGQQQALLQPAAGTSTSATSGKFPIDPSLSSAGPSQQD